MASCSGNGSRGHHKFTLNVNETYVSGGADNYSTVSWSLVLSPIQNGWDWNYSSTVPVSYKVTINGTDYTGNIMSYDGRSTVTIRSGTQNVTHNNDGTKSISFSFSVWDNVSASYLPGSASGSGSMSLTTIARYTSITSFSVSKRNETSVSVSFTTSDNCDWVWYSKDNGANWSNLPTSNIIDGLSPNTTYNFKIRVRRADSQLTTDSWTVAQTTYKAPSQSLRSKTETSITMNWSLDTTANHLWYSINNGSSWVEVGNVNATSGYYTISGLSANTTYNIKTRVRRSSTNTTYDSSTSSQATYNYPYCTNAPNFTIGNNVTISLYNPLNRTVEIQMWSHVSQGFVSDRISVTGTSYTGFSGVVNRLYASIPNTNQSRYNIDVWYGSNKAVKEGGYYKIVGNEVPTFTNFTYRDSNTDVTDVTGDDQVMVKGLSTPEITISSANKMVANNSASGKNYSMTIGNLSGSVDYSTEDIVKQLGTINTAGTQRLTVTAFDSRNLSTSANKDVVVYDYSKPVINASVTRLNNFENETTLRIQGTYNKLTIDDINKNSITSVEYRYKESGGDWGNWQTVTATVNDGSYTCSDVLLNLDNTKSFDFKVRVTDSLQQVTTNSYIVDVGKAIFFISSNQKKCYINGEEIIPGENQKFLMSKNLLNINNGFEKGYYDSNGNIVKDDKYALMSFIPINSSTSYGFSFINQVNVFYIYYFDENYNYINAVESRNFTKGSLISGPSAKYLRIAFNYDNNTMTQSTIKNLQPQVEQGTVTSYEPYVEKEILVKNNNGVFEKFYSEKVLDNYSANEQQIGTWINGKPLYRIVMTSTSYNSSSYSIPISNVKDIINVTGVVRRSDYSNLIDVIPSRLDNAGMSVQFGNITIASATTVTVGMTWGANWSSAFGSIILILEYTKTTD